MSIAVSMAFKYCIAVVHYALQHMPTLVAIVDSTHVYHVVAIVYCIYVGA